MSDAWVGTNTENAWVDLLHDEPDDAHLKWRTPSFEDFVLSLQDDIQLVFNIFVPLSPEGSKQVGYTPHRRCSRMPLGASTHWIIASVLHQAGVMVNWIGTSTRPMEHT